MLLLLDRFWLGGPATNIICSSGGRPLEGWLRCVPWLLARRTGRFPQVAHLRSRVKAVRIPVFAVW